MFSIYLYADTKIRQLSEANSRAETRLLKERTKKELIDSELRQLGEELRSLFLNKRCS